MNKKGFTLIEALAVIVLVGLLVVLISSKVMDSINESKEQTHVTNANSLVSAVEKYYYEKKMSSNLSNCSFNFDDDINTCDGFSFTGAKPDSGFISLNIDGTVECEFNYGDIRFYCENGKVVRTRTQYVFDETGEYNIIIPYSGKYKLEVWGAQGGTATSLRGGYGGYSSGIVFLNKDDILYVNVGGKGDDSTAQVIKANSGGYNGGGKGYVHRNTSGTSASGGGGATHIALKSGVLSSLSNDVDKILIVAGGGGGTHTDTDGNGYSSIGGSGGGYTGGSIVQTGSCNSSCTSYSVPSGGTQSSGGLGVTAWSTGKSSSTQYVGIFGVGATGLDSYGGGGGGFYGGASGQYNGGAGGSGYIGNPNLLNGVMYCYGCLESSDSATRTISTTGSNKDSVNCPNGYSDSAISNCAKAKDGYAKITYIGK